MTQISLGSHPNENVEPRRANLPGKPRPPRHRAAPYLFLTPYFIITSIFFLYPLAYATLLAFYQTNGPGTKVFVGLSNFRFLIGDSDFHKALWNTTIFAFFSLCLQLPLSLGLAMLLNGKIGRAKAFFRLAIFAPNLVGQVFVGVLFMVLFTPHYGLFNVMLQKVFNWGLDQQWLANPALVMPAIIIASLWIYVGFNMIYFLAALQNVDQSLIEAARIDGAGPVGIFFNVTIPAIVPVATFVVVTSTIGSFQLFELPFTLLQQQSGGYGPADAGLTVVGYLYRNAFDNGDLGTAAAIGWLLTFLVLAISLVQVWLSRHVGSET
jgi:ABC-type sugar transport system permease subunit